MITIGMVIPTWGKQCGVADYTKQLIGNIVNQSFRIRIYSEVTADLSSQIEKDSVDIVHFQHEYSIYDFSTMYRVLNELNQLNIPVVTTLHSWSEELVSHNLLISDMSTGIIAHSAEVKRLCIQHGFPPEKVVVVPIGCSSFPLEAKDKTKTLFDIQGFPCVGFFGFPFPHKGIGHLIEALNQLKPYFPDIKGYFFTHYPNYLDQNHPYYSFFQDLESQFRNHDHLIWCKDFLPDAAIVNLLHCMDVNVLPYVNQHQKGISAAVRLMLAAKRPIITTDYLYFSDLDEEVYKMPDAETGTIARSVCHVLLNSTLQERLISVGSLYLQTNSWEQIGHKYRKIYEKFRSARKERGEHLGNSFNYRNYRIRRKPFGGMDVKEQKGN